MILTCTSIYLYKYLIDFMVSNKSKRQGRKRDSCCITLCVCVHLLQNNKSNITSIVKTCILHITHTWCSVISDHRNCFLHGNSIKRPISLSHFIKCSFCICLYIFKLMNRKRYEGGITWCNKYTGTTLVCTQFGRFK